MFQMKSEKNIFSKNKKTQNKLRYFQITRTLHY